MSKVNSNHVAVKAAFAVANNSATLTAWLRDQMTAKAVNDEVIDVATYILLNRGKNKAFPEGQESQRTLTHAKAYRSFAQAFREIDDEVAGQRGNRALKADKANAVIYVGTRRAAPTPAGDDDDDAQSANASTLADAEDTAARLIDGDKNRGLASIKRMLEKLDISIDELVEYLEEE